MLGYVTKAEALRMGMTHTASYYGIPIYMTNADNAVVVARWKPLGYLFEPIHVFTGFMRSVLFPMDEPVFQFNKMKPL